MPEFKTARGMRDFLPKEAATMRYVEAITRELAGLYGFQEIITPIIESYELLAAKSGEEIRQRMYTFEDLGGRKLGLRPEFTASIARLMATTLRNEPKPLRLYCVGSLYRYDEPQFGRFREFWQSNFELIGSTRPEADAEILALTNDLLKRVGLQNYWFKIGHVGIVRGILGAEDVGEENQNKIMQLLDKKQWADALTLAKNLKVSDQCIATLKKIFEIKGKNSDRVIEEIKSAVVRYEKAMFAVDNLGEILELLKTGGVEFDMSIEAGFARGLEYYTGMIYEIYVPEMDIALGGGGRYDRLIELFGGEPTPATGIAHGIDRITLAMEKQQTPPLIRTQKRVMVIFIGEELKSEALRIASMLRTAGVSAELEVMGRAVTRALQDADRRGIKQAVILGPKEMEKGEVILRDMEKREQHTIKKQYLIKEIEKRTPHSA
ncbi:MAG: histidine--tRNA ligase [Candidatus Bathyarchaeia archaeon]|nr:histidine--tRNA ligase [Candidatus Bathyarchaeota archaeon A05DMB-4]MDH7595326.1 histidine--tRNA ligase [Candidatus Bathyarchaeota archaeon]